MTTNRTTIDGKAEEPKTDSTDTADTSQRTVSTEELAAENRELRTRLSELEGELAEIKAGFDGGSTSQQDEPAGQSTDQTDETPIVLTGGGMTCKIIGELDDDNGIGVYGANTSDSGATYGVEGVTESSSSDAAAVRANAPNGGMGLQAVSDGNRAIDAVTSGRDAIKAVTDGQNYNAIYGENSATSGWSWGVRGDTNSTAGEAYGVRGVANATSGSSKGVGGQTSAEGDDAAGVHGEATATSGAVFGVYGNTKSNDNEAAGVKGYASETFGVWGESDGRNGVEGRASSTSWGGVYGEHSATSGLAIGVIGRNNSPDGAAVWADAQDIDGVAVRAQGKVEATDTIHSQGDIEFSDGSRQRTAGPVAKASISSDATIDNAVNVDSVTWNDSVSRYEITLTDIDYFYSEYATNVTPLSIDYPIPRTGSGNDDLFVYFDDGNKHNFHFVVYELPSGTRTTSTEAESLDGEDPIGTED